MDNESKDKSDIFRDTELEGQICDCLDKGIRLHRFPEKLEKMYINHFRRSRINRFAWFGLIGLIFYNLFLIGDKQMLPDIFFEAFITRVFIVSPLILLAIAGILMKRLEGFADFLAGCIILLASISILYFLMTSKSTNVNNYHTGLIILIVVLNIVLRLRFIYAVGFTLIIFLLSAAAFYNIPLMHQVTVENSIMVLFTIAVLTLIGNYQIENENRFGYLNSLLRKINAARLEESNEKLNTMATTDGLTGLINRRHFDDLLLCEWKACRRVKQPLSLIFIDIDFFKKFNDNYGHQNGDDCLVGVAAVLHLNVKRPRDVVARYGGEEFVVLLPETDSFGVNHLAEQLRKSVEELRMKHNFSDVKDVVTISLGAATLLPKQETNCSELIKMADNALYDAKKQGRNRVCQHPESY